MTGHRHVWLLGKLVPMRGKRVCFVHQSCACGAKRVKRNDSRMVVETARWIDDGKPPIRRTRRRSAYVTKRGAVIRSSDCAAMREFRKGEK